MFKLLIHIFILGFIFSNTVWAQYVDQSQTQPLVMPTKVQDESFMNQMSSKILPEKVKENETGSEFLSQVADKSISYYWQVTPLRQSSIGRAAETVEKKMNVEADFKDDNQVEHKFSFKVLAVQALAKIEYSGWVNAALNYDAKSAQTKAEIIESISAHQDIVISHAVQNSEKQSELSMRWNW